MADTLSSRMFVNFLGIPGILLLVYLGGPWFIGFVTVVSLIALYEFLWTNSFQDFTLTPLFAKYVSS